MEKDEAKQKNDKKEASKKEPDYDYWIKFDQVKIWEAILLLFGEQPERKVDHYNHDEYDSFVYKNIENQFDEDQYILYEIIKRSEKYKNINFENDDVDLKDFITFLSENEYSNKILQKNKFYNRFIKIKNLRLESENIKKSDIKYLFSKNITNTWNLVFDGMSCGALRNLKGLYIIQELIKNKNEYVNCEVFYTRNSETGSKKEEINDFCLNDSHSENESILPPEDFSEDENRKINELKLLIIEYHEIGETIKARELEDELLEYFKKFSEENKSYKIESKNIKNARQAVTKNIMMAIDEINKFIPEMGEHLIKYIDFGALTIYQPPEGIDWHF